MYPPAKTIHHESGTRWWHVSLSRAWGIVAVIVPLLLVASLPMGMVDLAYHLRAGAMMLAERTLVTTDTFTFTAAGQPWVDPQWLGQVVLAAAYGAGGWLALAVLRILLSGIALAGVHAACRARGATVRAAAWLTLASAMVVLPGLLLRPQLFGMACFAIALWLLAGRSAHPARIWLLIPLVALWANLHGTFFLAVGLVGLAWLEDIDARDRRAWRLVLVGSAALAAAMVNPYGAKLWLYVVQLSSNTAVRRLVTEWQPTSIDSWSGAAFIASVPIAAFLAARTGSRLRWPMLLSLGSFFLIGIVSVRGVYWWAMAAPVVLAGTKVGRLGGDRPGPVHVANSLLVGTLIIALLVTTGRWIPYRSAASDPPPPAPWLAEAPMGITQALQRTLKGHERIFNAQLWGSWFEFALPGHPVAVDSRIEVIPGTTWTHYVDISSGREGWQQLLAEWDVRVVALHLTQQAPLLRRIEIDAGWERVYEDQDGAVFVRK